MKKKKNASSKLKEFGEILVMTVKELQKKSIQGVHGTWKQFLSNIDKSASIPGPQDPARRPVAVLEQFIESLNSEESKKFVKRLKNWRVGKKVDFDLFSSPDYVSSKLHELVLATRNHPKFGTHYTFPSHEEGWVHVPSTKPESPDVASLLAVDCEMCQCKNQERQVIRVSIVNGKNEVLVNSLVKPTLPVVNYVTNITGITAEDLEEVNFSQVQAQQSLVNLLTPGTILVGHALHHDLKSLKIDYGQVIDTSLIFGFRDLPDLIPSLSHLCQVLLKKELRLEGAVHDSIDDALIPVQLVQFELESGPTEPLDPPVAPVEKSEQSKLFLHRIPKGISPEDLKKVFSANQHVPHVQMVNWKPNGLGSTFALFPDPEKANLAFQALVGTEGKDSFGRAQKEVKLGFEEIIIVVRKMADNKGMMFGVQGRKGIEGTTPIKSSANGTPLVGTTGEDFIEGGMFSPSDRREIEFVEDVKTPSANGKNNVKDGANKEENLTKSQKRELKRKRKRDETKVEKKGGNEEENGVPDGKHPHLLTETTPEFKVGDVGGMKKELEDLRRKLAKKDAEVKALQQLVTELVTKQAGI